jgi:hypothetical protein
MCHTANSVHSAGQAQAGQRVAWIVLNDFSNLSHAESVVRRKNGLDRSGARVILVLVASSYHLDRMDT